MTPESLDKIESCGHQRRYEQSDDYGTVTCALCLLNAYKKRAEQAEATDSKRQDDCYASGYNDAKAQLGQQHAEVILERDQLQLTIDRFVAEEKTAVANMKVIREQEAKQRAEDTRLLREARETLADVQSMTRVHEEVPQWGWPDYSQQMKSIRRVAGKGNAALAKALEGRE